MQQATLCMVELNQLGDQTYQHYILKHLGKKRNVGSSTPSDDEDS